MITASSRVPPHVPQDLVVDVDFYDLPGAEQDVFAAWKAQLDQWRTLRSGNAPLVWTVRNGGHWIAANGDALEDLYPDTENLSNSSISIPSYEGLKIFPGQADGEEHTAYRAAVMKRFNPRAVRELREPIERIATQLIDEFEPRGECDFVAEFAYRLPIILFLDMMDLPVEDGDYLLEQAHRTIRASSDHEKHDALAAIFRYLAGVVAERRVNPGDDLISQLHQTPIAGKNMTQEAVHGISVNLLLGGLDTVASMLGFIMQHLAQDDAARQRLASDPDRMDHHLDEIVRRFPIASLSRVVAQDFEYRGTLLKKNDRLFLPSALHGLDERKFERPMELDFDRKVTTSMTFGRGAHQCLGSYVARIELAVTLRTWLARIPYFRIAPGADIRIASGAINAIKSLPLQWTPAGLN